MTLPAKFVERVLRDLGGTEGAALCAALDAEPPVSVRLNPAKTGADTLPAGPDAGLPVPEAAGLPALAIAGRVPWSRDGRYLAVRPSFTLDPDFHAGAYYVQEASSQFVGHRLAAVRTEGARILDLCAAPGGKTTLYASLAGPDGLVVANEIDRRRASVLADNVRKWGTGNVAVTTCEPGVSLCRPICSAFIPPDAETMVVSTASDATNCADWPLKFCKRPRMAVCISGICGRKSASSSATPSTEKPGTRLTSISTHISSGKDAVSRNSVADPA